MNLKVKINTKRTAYKGAAITIKQKPKLGIRLSKKRSQHVKRYHELKTPPITITSSIIMEKHVSLNRCNTI